MVHILFRHGERLSFNGRASKQHTLQDCALNTSVFGSEEKLKEFIQTMTKFARKQPPESDFKNYDLLPNEKNCRRPDLTGTGAAQLIKLGEYFREKYVTKSGLFSREISLTNQLYICSSNAARTYQSMIGFLYGFFKSTYFNLTNFNIISSDHNFCSYDKPAQIKCNTKYGAVLRRQMNSRRRSYFLSSASGDFLMSLKDAKTNSTTRTFVGTRIGNYKLFADMISLTYCRNRSKLCLNGQADCLHSSHFDGIWEKMYQENRFVHENSPEAKHYYATYYPILSKIVNRSKDYINGKGNNEKKLFVYGGHETGIFALLHILGLNGGRLTNFASRIVMEFYEAQSKTETFIKNKYYFRIFYEGDDITQYVIFCIGKTFRGLCEFSLFYDFVYSKMSQLLRESTFESK